jgi:hypothetical protein
MVGGAVSGGLCLLSLWLLLLGHRMAGACTFLAKALRLRLRLRLPGLHVRPTMRRTMHPALMHPSFRFFLFMKKTFVELGSRELLFTDSAPPEE